MAPRADPHPPGEASTGTLGSVGADTQHRDEPMPDEPVSDQPVPGESIWTIVVAGGTGRRFGGPKQYEVVGRQRVLDHSRGTAALMSSGVVVVVPADDVATEGGVAGGATRTESVRNGLAAVPDDATIVCVHDAARPFASPDLYRAVIAAIIGGADAAVPGVAVTDTIKVVAELPADATGSGAQLSARRVIDTPARDTLVAVQTPQAFRSAALRDAHRRAELAGDDATDDAALVERGGGLVVVVPGELDNRKITQADDLRWARDRVDQIERAGASASVTSDPATSEPASSGRGGRA